MVYHTAVDKSNMKIFFICEIYDGAHIVQIHDAGNEDEKEEGERKSWEHIL